VIELAAVVLSHSSSVPAYRQQIKLPTISLVSPSDQREVIGAAAGLESAA
jgi:hypothetical protein